MYSLGITFSCKSLDIYLSMQRSSLDSYPISVFIDRLYHHKQMLVHSSNCLCLRFFDLGYGDKLTGNSSETEFSH